GGERDQRLRILRQGTRESGGRGRAHARPRPRRGADRGGGSRRGGRAGGGRGRRMEMEKGSAIYRRASPLPESARQQIAAALNVRLADGLDLHSQIKVAHWNVKGPHFAALHPLFESFATTLTEQNDATAERAVALGALAYGTARHVA